LISGYLRVRGVSWTGGGVGVVFGVVLFVVDENEDILVEIGIDM
jgi:hypothetical protein